MYLSISGRPGDLTVSDMPLTGTDKYFNMEMPDNVAIALVFTKAQAEQWAFELLRAFNE